MAVWCEAEDPAFVYCIPMLEAKDGGSEGKLLFRKHAKKSLVFVRRDVTFNYFS